MSDMNPTSVCNEALDKAGINWTLGDIQEGSDPAKVCLRAYRRCLQQMLRAAPWQFARKQAEMTLLGDATGQTPNVGKNVVIPWVYEYEYPIDCIRARFVPMNPNQISTFVPPNNAQLPNVPLFATGNFQVMAGTRLQPARFLVATDFNYPPPAGAVTWETQGVSPEGRTVILTNVRCAMLVYTCFVRYPSLWDPSFREALVAFIASEVALPLWANSKVGGDKRIGITIRAQNIAIAKKVIEDARVADGNEMGFGNTDHVPDWMQNRRGGGGWGRNDGPGYSGYGYDSCGFADGSMISSIAAF